MHELTKLILDDMKPALGVTEPGAIAFAVSTAREHINGAVGSVTLRLNSGMFKNAHLQFRKTHPPPRELSIGSAHPFG